MTILTLEQYNSVNSVLTLLHKLQLQKVESVHQEFQDMEGDDWLICGYCDNLLDSCRCNENPIHFYGLNEDP